MSSEVLPADLIAWCHTWSQNTHCIHNRQNATCFCNKNRVSRVIDSCPLAIPWSFAVGWSNSPVLHYCDWESVLGWTVFPTARTMRNCMSFWAENTKSDPPLFCITSVKSCTCNQQGSDFKMTLSIIIIGHFQVQLNTLQLTKLCHAGGWDVESSAPRLQWPVEVRFSDASRQKIWREPPVEFLPVIKLMTQYRRWLYYSIAVN